jgi:hypothetical protein
LTDYVLSLSTGRLALSEARALARRISFSQLPARGVELRTGAAPGIFHVIVSA